MSDRAERDECDPGVVGTDGHPVDDTLHETQGVEPVLARAALVVAYTAGAVDNHDEINLTWMQRIYIRYGKAANMLHRITGNSSDRHRGYEFVCACVGVRNGAIYFGIGIDRFTYGIGAGIGI